MKTDRDLVIEAVENAQRILAEHFETGPAAQMTRLEGIKFDRAKIPARGARARNIGN